MKANSSSEKTNKTTKTKQKLTSKMPIKKSIKRSVRGDQKSKNKARNIPVKKSMRNSYLNNLSNRSPAPVGKKGARKISSNSDLSAKKMDFKKKAKTKNEAMEFDVGKGFMMNFKNGKKASSRSPGRKAKSPGRSNRRKVIYINI